MDKADPRLQSAVRCCTAFLLFLRIAVSIPDPFFLIVSISFQLSLPFAYRVS